MSKRITRRKMLRCTAAAGAGLWLAGSRVKANGASPNEKLDIALIGIGGRGGANLGGVKGENIVALCDVDDQRAGKTYGQFPKAKKYYDYRKMLDELENHIDAVVVSTPDHTHAHPSLMALRMGKHLYCEKPMAHAVSEVRAMTDLARVLQGVDRRLQGRGAGHLQLRLHRPDGRVRAAGQPGLSRGRGVRVGRRKDAGAGLPGGRAARQPDVPQGLAAVAAIRSAAAVLRGGFLSPCAHV